MASAAALAVLFISCHGKLGEAEKINMAETPMQTLEDMFAVQTKNGALSVRMEAPIMMSFDNDTVTYETFPNGVSIYAYTPEGLLQTVIVADNGKHISEKDDGGRPGRKEIWEAFGHVIVHNVIKQETMETDTLYWDRTANEIYTDCYVQFFSPDGYMQGTGMRSDDRAENAILYNPFNSYGVAEKDTTKVLIDSVNFIGPLLRR